MTSVRLAFVDPVHAGPGPVTLRFGGSDAPAPGVEVPAALSAVLPAVIVAQVSASATAHVAVVASAAAALPAAPVSLQMSATAQQDLALPDAIAVDTAVRHAHGRAVSIARTVEQQHMRSGGRAAHCPQRHGARRSMAVRCQSTHMLTVQRATRSKHAHGLPIGRSVATAAAHMLPAQRAARAATAHGLPVVHQVATAAAHMLQLHGAARAPAAHGLALSIAAAARIGHGTLVAPGWRLVWAHAIPPAPGMWHPGRPLPPAPGVDPTRAVLRFSNQTWERDILRFGVYIGERGRIPIREYYIVMNEFSLRLADNTLIEVGSFSAQLSADAWGWSWSAAAHGDVLSLVDRDDPDDVVGLMAAINGNAIALTVGGIDEQHVFARHELRLSGSCPADALSAPHAAEITRRNAAGLTARQLLDDALTHNGVPIGWDVDWQIVDWFVTAGAWSHQGTPMAAAIRIAEAGGAYVQAHDTWPTLIVLPRYPLPPWLWHTLTPDVVVPAEVARVVSLTRVDRARYNGVYISGTRTDRYRRAGTAADRLAPMIVDPLATAPEMTRQRGRAAISDTGRQWHVGIQLPVLPETGIIRPGKIVDYTDGSRVRRGISRAVQIDVNWPRIYQTVTIETHAE